MTVTSLDVTLAGIRFANPVLLAAGTAAYGREVADVMPLESLGGFVTKAVSLEPRLGAAAPRVSDFDGGMINAVGLANPGVDAVLHTDLPWIAANVKRPRVLVNVVGRETHEFGAVIARLDGAEGFHGYELNVSCPNVRQGGIEFCADPHALSEVVRGARRATRRPLFVKLSPTLSSVADAARVAVDAGADGISVINTIPGLVVDVERRRPALGFGSGGVSGAGLLAVGVLAVWRVRQALPSTPVIGVGGIQHATDIVQYLMAGAAAVAVGTVGLADPKRPARLVRDLARWCERHGVSRIIDLVGTLEWPR